MGLFDFLKPKTPPVVAAEELEKSVVAAPSTEFMTGQVDKTKIVYSLESKMTRTDGIYQKKGRLLDKELRELAQYDSIVSLIISTRHNQMMPFGKPARNKYDRGFLLREVLSVDEDGSIPVEEKEMEAKSREQLMKTISKWIASCGTTNPIVSAHVFSGSDTFFNECSLSDFLSAQARNMLVFGRCATQIIRNKYGVPIMFRPIPVETLYRVIPGKEFLLLSGQDKDIPDQAYQDLQEWKNMDVNMRPKAYVQRIDGKNVSFFTEKDIKVIYYQKQAYDNLDGYPLAPIEQAHYMMGLHFNAQNYMTNSLTRGLASKGIINLRSEEEGVSKEELEMMRKSLSNYVARNDNSATIPIFSGPVEVQFIPLNATAKDLEFLNLYNKVIQILCASFQIAPAEIGFSNIDQNKASLGNDSKQDQIVQGEERGLRQLIDNLFDHVMSIVYETFAQAKDVVRIEAIGIGQNTKELDLQVYKEELQTSGTFGKIWADSERPQTFPFGGNMPTSPIFHQSVANYMKYSEIRHYFFNEKDALQNPAYDFIINPALDQTYQALKSGTAQMAADQMAIQTQMMQQPPPEEPMEESVDDGALMMQQMELEMNQQQHEQDMLHTQEEHQLKMTMEQMKMAMEQTKMANQQQVQQQQAQQQQQEQQAQQQEQAPRSFSQLFSSNE